MGGLPRRNHTVAEWKQKGEVVVLDVGSSLAPRAAPERWASEPKALEQRRGKARLIANSYAVAGIDAMAFGSSDWMLGREFLLDLVEAHQLPVLAANLSCEGQSPFAGSQVVEVAGRKIGVVGFTEGAPEGCTAGEPIGAMRKELASLGPVDLAIALAPTREAEVLVPLGSLGFDVVLDGRGRHSTGSPQRYGDAWFYGAGTRGKHMGIMEIGFRSGGRGLAPVMDPDRLNREMDRLNRELASATTALETAADPSRRVRLEAQRASAEEKMNEKLRLRKASEDDGVHTLAYHEVGLTADVPDDAQTRTLVEAAQILPDVVKKGLR